LFAARLRNCLASKMFYEKSLGFLDAFLCHADRLCFATGIYKEAYLLISVLGGEEFSRRQYAYALHQRGWVVAFISSH
jgi:hypothetical protein